MNGPTGVIIAYVLGIGILWGYAIFVLVSRQMLKKRRQEDGERL